MLQFWFWLTPIIYVVDVVPESARRLIALNPLAGPIHAYQHIILQSEWPAWSDATLLAATAAVTLAAGFFAFWKLSGEMIDEI
jgi:lipopolysaccharide transport system permease protein